MCGSCVWRNGVLRAQIVGEIELHLGKVAPGGVVNGIALHIVGIDGADLVDAAPGALYPRCE